MTDKPKSQDAYILTLADYYDLMRYYIYGECIECRAAMLNLDRAYVDFINCVYRYASLLFAEPGTFTAGELEQRKQEMWRFGWENQKLYLTLLKNTAKRKKAKNLDLSSISNILRPTITPKGDAFFALQKGYAQCVAIDDTPCSYAETIEKKGAPSSRSMDIGADIWSAIGERVDSMNKALALLDRVDAILMRKEEKPGPAAVAASLHVFVAHLGRAFVRQYIRPDGEEEKNKEERRCLGDETNKILKDSQQHLERALFDAYKEILIAVIRRHALFHESKCATEKWWDSLTKARKLEHDRTGEDFSTRFMAYKQLEPGILQFLDYVQARPGSIPDPRPKKKSDSTGILQKIYCFFFGQK